MKNLKKVLSLALVFAMVLGLCIGAMAAETQDITTLSDWDSVTHKEAVTLLNAFNIMQGYPSGNFQPNKTVTRAEAVKMIDVGLWGGVDQPELFASYDVAFSDVKPTDWYAGHVTYAQALGILDGFTDGTFRPNDTVTGYQMLKMALIALNYNSEAEGLTGAGWDIRTMRLATDPTVKNLTAGLDEITNWNAPLTRDQAAQIIYNMIQHSTVTYTLTQNGQGGSVKSFNKDNFGVEYLKMGVKHGIVAANDYGMVNKFAGKASVWDTNKSGTASAAKGQNTIIRLKDETTGALLADAADAYVICSTDSGLSDIGANATLYYKGTTLISVAIDTPVEMTPAADGSNFAATTTVVTADSKGHDVTKYFDADGDGKIDIENTISYTGVTNVSDVVASETWGDVYVTGTSTWRNTYEKSKTLPSTILSDVVFADGIEAAKGDMIAYAATKSATGTDIKVAVVLDSTTGAIDRIVNTDKATVKTYYIDGEAHNGTYTEGQTNLAFGDDGIFYFYPDGYIAYSDVEDKAPDTLYAVVYKMGYNVIAASTGVNGGKGSITVQAAVTLQDNTTGIYEVAKWNDTKISDLDETDDLKTIIGTNYSQPTGRNDNKLITYTLNSDGSINIKTINTTKVASATDAKSGIAKFDDKYFTSKSVVFMSNGKTDENEAWTAYTGIPTFDYTVNANGAELVGKDLYTTGSNDGIVAMLVTDGSTTTAPSTGFVYVFSNNGQYGVTSTGDAIYQLSVYDANSGTVGTIDVTGEGVDEIKAGDFYETYTAATKTLGKKIETSTGYKKGFVTVCGNGVIVLSHAETADDGKSFTVANEALTYDNNTKFYLIDGENSAAITVADVEPQVVDGIGDKTGTFFGDYYQALVKTDGTQVIIFAERQGTQA